MSLEPERARLARCCARFSPGGLEDYLQLYHYDALLHGYGPEPLRALPSIRAFYQGILAAYPDARITLEDTFGEGDRLAARFRFEGTHQGPFLGVPATGRPVAFGGITILRFLDGRCIERWSVADFLSALAQVGGLPPPA